jgi:hypothetical protein
MGTTYHEDRTETAYANMRVTRLGEESHNRTCGYWYTVTCGAMAFTAFRSRRALDMWMRRCNLQFEGLESNLDNAGDSVKIQNGFTHVCHWRSTTMPAGEPVPVMSNGEYVQGVRAVEDGYVTIHFPNPNCPDKIVLDYRATDAALGQAWNQADPFSRKEGAPV